MNARSEFHCPHCLHPIETSSGVRQEVLFELCARCGSLWLDFGQTRPRLYTAVEAQSARWDRQNQAGSFRRAG